MCIFKSSFQTVNLDQLRRQTRGGRDSPLVVRDWAQRCSHDCSRRHGAAECGRPLGGAVGLGASGAADSGGARASGVSRQGLLRRAGLLQLLPVRGTTETFSNGHQVALTTSEWPARPALRPRSACGCLRRRRCHVVFIFARVRS